ENSITEIMQGKADAALDAIPRSKLPLLQTDDKWKPYLHVHAQARTSYLWMNTGVAPFDNPKVRQAVNWAINRRAMVKLGGGSGIPSSTILPPNVPGYTGYEPYPKQDLAKARQLVKESGVKPGKVVLWSSTAPPSPEMAQYVQEQLKQLGFDVRTRSVDSSSYYDIVGADTTKAQIGFASWGQDFPEASNFIDVLLNGVYINPKKSNNLAWYHRKDGEIAQVNQLLDLEARAKAWGRLDREIVEDGAWAPISHGVQRNLVSKRLGGYVSHPVYDLLFAQATVDGSGTNNAKTHEHEAAESNPDASKDGEGS
ncbi:MAG: hypothetical protein JWM98_3004, partial [Thermoleophilia bacterium]|nr:hypothetical protein [Thermoleophilia bacterium]